MKKIKMTGPRMLYLGAILCMLVQAIACSKKNELPQQPVAMQKIATLLEGEVLNGSITTESDEEGLALWCNGGKILIAIGKLASTTFTDPGHLEHAEVVYSAYGIVVRDVTSNKTWFYIQNDAQSQQRFEKLVNGIELAIVCGTNGTMRLNIS